MVVIGFLYTLFLVRDEYKRVYTINDTSLKTTQKYSLNKCPYYADTTDKSTENGNYIYSLICEDELEKEWDKRSNINYRSLDNKQNSLRHTLMRYLTSKGLTKDSFGVANLTNTDVKYIENGFANYLYIDSRSLRTRIHEIIWEVATRNHEINGHSLVMRLEFWKTALYIIKQNLWFGAGTGDVKIAFREQYEKENTCLQKVWQLRSHNQYLATTVALGLVGLLLFLIHLITPFFSKKKLSVFFIFFLLIELLSFINEDTLETQAGLTFCVFFTQLLFHNDEYNV